MPYLGLIDIYALKTSYPIQVGSRRVVQWAAGLMIVQGVVGKLGAVFIIIPQPIVGGLFCVMFGMISAFGEFPVMGKTELKFNIDRKIM